ncbi:MAG: S-layer homology domain-containing protein [Syntrophomonas sp.]
MIKNLVINYPKKYVGLFGYIGDENLAAYVKNVALVNCNIIGQQNVGGIAGVAYGTITNCYVSGKIRVDDLSNAHTGGGIAGKVKEGEGPIIGYVENCYTDVQMEAPYDVGGIVGIQDGGGYVGHSFAAGTVSAYGANGSAGGIAGSFNAGDRIVGCVSAQTSITGARNTDKIVGQLDDEAAANITGNVAWEGTLLAGNEPAFQPIKWEDISGAALSQKATYTGLDWDFDSSWDWVGSDNYGYVKLKGFTADLFTKRDWRCTGTRIISRAVNETKLGTAAEVMARVLSAYTIKSVELYYGNSSDGTTFSDKVQMIKTGDTYVGAVPAKATGTIYYYIKVVTDQETITKPYSASAAIGVYVDDGTIQGAPSQITIVPDTKQGNLRFSWITVPQVTESVVQYKIKGTSSWQTEKGTSYVDAVTPGWKELSTHQAVLQDLIPNAAYVYRVGDGKDFMSEENSFKAPSSPDADSFSFIYAADPQSVSTDDYMSFKKSLDYATSILPHPAFVMSGGDTTQDGYKATEWEACFKVMGDYYASIPNITVPGNHEMKGDWGFTSFVQRFNMPGGKTGNEFDDTIGCIEYGDACIVVINTEVSPPAEKADIIRKQLQWAKECYEKSNKKWRIMLTHAGPYTSNHDPLEVRDYFVNDSEYSVDALKIDLFLNGHDHIYIRSTVKNDIKVNTGDGTTYVTGGTVGNKYYEYMPERSDYSTTAYYDDQDRQTFTIFTVAKDKIIARAYQCDNDDIDAKEELEAWNQWMVKDAYEIRNSLSEGKKITDYTDVKSSDWYYDAAAFVIDKKLIGGEQAYVFGANEKITRAEAAAVFYNLAGQPAYQMTAAFQDVNQKHPQKQAISWASANGIMQGIGDGKFDPDGLVDREQFATLLARYVKFTGKSIANNTSLAAFSDINSISLWAKEGIGYCVEAGIIIGNPDGTFAPQEKITRAELSAMFYLLNN